MAHRRQLVDMLGAEQNRRRLLRDPGQLDRRRIAALVGLAPGARDSGAFWGLA